MWPVRLPDCLSPPGFLSKPAGVHECCVAWLGHPHVLVSSNFEVIPQLPHSQVGELLTRQGRLPTTHTAVARLSRGCLSHGGLGSGPLIG